MSSGPGSPSDFLPVMSSSSSRDGSYKSIRSHQIHDEIAKFSNSIIVLKTELNTLSAVSVLPPEILSLVFLALVEVSKIVSYPLPRNRFAIGYRWIQVTHVCKHWRAVALACPALWSQVTITSDCTWMEEVVRRSRKAALSITAQFKTLEHFSARAKLESLSLLLEESTRVRSLSIDNSPAFRESLHSLSQFIGAPFPNLRTLMWRVTTSDYGEYVNSDEWPSANAPLRMLIQPYNTGCLQCLEIGSDHVMWDDLAAPLLKYLKITGSQGAIRPKLASLLAALERLPLLETLHLEANGIPSLPHDVVEVPVATETVALPQLSSASFTAAIQDCVHLINHLSFPALCDLTVDVWSDRGVDALAPCLANKASSLLNRLRMLTIGKNGYRTCRLHGYETDEPEALPAISDTSWRRPKHNYLPSIIINVAAGPRNTRNWHPFIDTISVLCRTLQVPSASTLLVFDFGTIGSGHWKSALSNLTHVSVLSVQGDCADSLFDALKPEENNAELKVALPHLTTLRLDNVRLSDSYSYHEGTEGEGVCRLMGALESRRECGVPIAKLQLVRCMNIDDSTVERIQEATDDLEWDHEVTIESEDEEDEEEDEYFSDDIYYDDVGFDDLDFDIYGPIGIFG